MGNLLSTLCVFSVFLLITLACNNPEGSSGSKPLPPPSQSVSNNTLTPSASPSETPAIVKKKTPKPKPSATPAALDVYASSDEKEKDETDRNGDTRNGYSTSGDNQSRVSTDSSRVYITGPRGGCYYWNRNGNKTYVDHSYCGRSDDSSSSSSSPSSSGSYIRGPRGGCYTYTGSGRKRYVDRSLCN